MNIDKLKKVMSESLPEKILKDIDGRHSSHAPWKKRPPFGKKRYPTHLAIEVSDEEDVNALEDEGDDNFEADWDDQDADDTDQVAYVDEEGWFYADEETIDVVDEGIAWDDEEYAQ